MPGKADYQAKMEEWHYCYCRDCGKMRYSHELEATEKGIRCIQCGGYNLEAPAWVHCPHRKDMAVMCPRGGKGVIRGELGYECEYRCNFI